MQKQVCWSNEGNLRTNLELLHDLETMILEVKKKKIDELLFIRNNELLSYFSFRRSGKKHKIFWQFGDDEIADSIILEILKVQKKTSNKITSAEKVFIYRIITLYYIILFK